MSVPDFMSMGEDFDVRWRRLKLRGAVLLGIGAALAFGSLFNPKLSIMHGDDFGLLPACGLVVLSVGLLEGFDAYRAKESSAFLLNLQTAILDIVVAFLVIFSMGDKPARLELLIAAFLIVKGIYRILIAYASKLPHLTLIQVTSGISILLGFCVWRAWPSSAGWFLAFCLSLEIAMRGYGLRTFGEWLRVNAVKPDGANTG